jgi:hypothetical protein
MPSEKPFLPGKGFSVFYYIPLPCGLQKTATGGRRQEEAGNRAGNVAECV